MMGAYLKAPAAQLPMVHKQVHDVLLQFLPSGPIESLAASSLNEWLSGEPAKAKALLLTSKSSTPTMFTKLSLDFGAGVRFAELRSSETAALKKLKELGSKSLAKLLETPKFPMLLLAGPGGGAKKLKKYDGPLKLAAIAEELKKISPGVIVPELHKQTMFEEVCASKGGICVVGLLPGRFDEPVETLRQVAGRQFPGQPGQAAQANVHFAWINADRQEAFAEGFDVEHFPSLIAVNPRKKRYRCFERAGAAEWGGGSAMKGTFDVESIRGFISRTLTGKEPLARLEKVPKLEKNGPSVSSAKMDKLMRGEL